MKHIKYLYEDFKKRIPESVAIFLASVAAPLSLYASTYGVWEWIARTIFVSSIIIIISMISISTSQGLHQNKRVLFSTIIITVLLILSVIHAISAPLGTLFSFSINKEGEWWMMFDIYIAPIFLMTTVVGISLMVWRVAEIRNRKSKQIKGINSKDLFS